MIEIVLTTLPFEYNFDTDGQINGSYVPRGAPMFTFVSIHAPLVGAIRER